MTRTDEVRAQQRGHRTPCPKNPNGYDYHRWHHRTEALDGDRVRSWVVCSWCDSIRDKHICPPHQPSVAYACPGFVRVVTCAACLSPLPEAHL